MKTFKIELTEEQLNYIGQVLAMRPYGEVNQLVASLQEQVKRDDK